MSNELPDPRLRTVYRLEAAVAVIYETDLVE